jgi:hypothetical protein
MTIDDIEHNKIYEYQRGRTKIPLYVIDKIPTGVVGQNLNTKREVFVPVQDIPKRINHRIDSMQEWRLHNGE